MIHIVVVDDEVLFCRGLRRMMEEIVPEYCTVHEAYDGTEVLERWDEWTPGLIVTDIRMQIMGGLELIREARERQHDLLAVLVSSYSEFDYARDAIRLDVEDYLLKPVTASDLSQLMGRVLPKLRQLQPAAAGTVIEKTMDPIKLYLQEHYNKPVSLVELSMQFGLVPNYLSSLFKREHGMSPGEYQTRLRVDKAKEIMDRTPGILLKQVANEVGYEDPLYFSRVFKKVTGQSPSEYLQR